MSLSNPARVEVARLPVGKPLGVSPLPKSASRVYTQRRILDGDSPLTPQMSESPSRVYTRYEGSDEAVLLCGVSPVGRVSATQRSQKVHPVCTRVVHFLAEAVTFRWSHL